MFFWVTQLIPGKKQRHFVAVAGEIERPEELQEVSEFTMLTRRQPSQVVRRIFPFRTGDEGNQAERDMELDRVQNNEAEGYKASTSVPSLSFDSLQRLQYLEDKVGDARLVIEVNSKVLRSLKSYLQSIGTTWNSPQALQAAFCRLMPVFEARLDSIFGDFEMQRSRLEALFRIVIDRKMLVSCMITRRCSS